MYSRIFFLIASLFWIASTVLATSDVDLLDGLSKLRMIKRAKHHQHSHSGSSKKHSHSSSKSSKSTNSGSRRKHSKGTSSKVPKITVGSKSKSGKSKSGKSKGGSTKSKGSVGNVKTFKVPQAFSQLASKVSKNHLCPHKFSDVKFKDGGVANVQYCGTSKKGSEIVYWMANMDVDCDGAEDCKGNPDFQAQTAFKLQNKFLNAAKSPYVVVNQNKQFNFENTGLKGLSMVAVVCGDNYDKLVWGYIGDTNPFNQIGEGAISIAQACFGKSVNGNNAAPNPVLYIGVTGEDAVVDSPSASSIASLGNKLLPNIQAAIEKILK